ncbi:TolC family protein [Tunturiibacter lichenicola]|uniref:TolC family protein n=1 Tax=Tunturiibacter lichenicola TaxID=2051959 RepID=UPI003D9AC3B8
MYMTIERSSRQWFPPAKVAVLLLLILGTKAEVMKAQGAPSADQKLSLKGAVDLALKQNLDIQIGDIETATQQQDRVIARSELLPHASFEADESDNRYNLKAQIGIQIPNVPHSIGPYQAVHVGPTFSAPVFDLTLIRQYEASGHRLLASRADEQTVREETVLLTVSEYMAHLRALASITAAESRVELATRLAHQADDLLRDGVASKIDVSRAQVRLREEQQHLIDAERDADTTLYALKRIINVPDSQKIEFADQQDFFQTPSLDLSDPLLTALVQRPELHSLAESIKAAQLTHKAAVAESLPKFTFDGFWNEQGQTFNKATPGYEYRVSMRVPIFTGGRLRAERKSTALAEQRTEKQLAQERNQVTEQVRDGQVELQSALHQVDLGRQEVQLANEEVTLSQGRFQSGVTDNIEVTQAQDSLARANDTEIGALFRYNIARAQLARAVGSVEQTYTHP